jgi:hypothetical protein
MTTESDALPVGDIIERKAGGEGPLSVREAARSLIDTRNNERAQLEKQAEQPQAAPAEAAPAEQPPQESAGEADAAPPQEAPGETQEAEPAEDQPPIEPPRSWTKAEKERFNSLPRETQEYLATREQEREREVRRSQNEAAEKTKALTAKEQAAEQVRQQYEQALPLLMQALQEQHQGEFSDVRTIADIERLAREDWPRYVLWDAQQKKIAAVQQQVQVTQQREEQEKTAKWSTFAKDEDAKFLEKAPEFSNKETMTKATQAAADLLKDLGFSDTELGKLWNGQDNISLRDHRLQLLLRDGVRYRQAQEAAKKVSAAPKPPVQRPGSSAPRTNGADAEISALTKQLETSRGLEQIRIAARLRTLTQSMPAR